MANFILFKNSYYFFSMVQNSNSGAKLKHISENEIGTKMQVGNNKFDFSFFNEVKSLIRVFVEIESFWTEDYAGQISNNGHELTIHILCMTILKLCWYKFTYSAYFIIFLHVVFLIDQLTYPY